uniref:CPW-WPC domain-containing protein n=1 Tax=viral metagenome TaxID=1070528 RepID=A0A6C0JCP3_9ZZZZ
MDTFTKVLIIVCVIFLGGYYIYQYRKFLKEQDKLTWPRMLAECPDYWVKEGNSCKNMFNIGDCPKGKDGLPEVQGTVDFSSEMYKGKKGNYNKCRWAKKCNAPWEGIDKLCAA